MCTTRPRSSCVISDGCVLVSLIIKVVTLTCSGGGHKVRGPVDSWCLSPFYSGSMTGFWKTILVISYSFARLVLSCGPSCKVSVTPRRNYLRYPCPKEYRLRHTFLCLWLLRFNRRRFWVLQESRYGTFI